MQYRTRCRRHRASARSLFPSGAESRPWADEIGWGQSATEGATASQTMLLLCGIMGRPWAVQAFLSNPDSLTLCLGSYFDDVGLGRVLKYAGGQRLRCKRCLRMG